jgi:hypothetical protein
MNERIKLLAEQAMVTLPAIEGPLSHTYFDKEKFAELIGIECLSIADSIRDECDKDGESQQALGAAWVGIAIARHFGVDE